MGLHEEIRNYDAFQKSTRRFTNFTKRIGGASDIDCFIERNNCFLFLEGKPLLEDGKLIRIPWGQYTALLRLAGTSYKIKVYIIGEDAVTGAPKMILNMNYTVKAKQYLDEELKKWMVDIPTDDFADIDAEKLEQFVFSSYKMFEQNKTDHISWREHEVSSLL